MQLLTFIGLVILGGLLGFIIRPQEQLVYSFAVA